MTLSRWLTCVVMPIAGIACAGVAISQEVPQSSVHLPGVLEEIVVTAEKRDATVQTTSISITAITGQDLSDRGISNVADALAGVAGVSYSSSGPGQSQFEIRGLSANGGESPTVGFYLDEVSVTPPAGSTNGKVAIDPNLYDLERIEVLRGPQGALYGAGAMGGTIKLVTAQPDPRSFSGSGETTISGTPKGGVSYGQNAMVNLPFAEGQGALRLVGTYAHIGGWIDRVVEAKFPLETNPDPNGQFYGLMRGSVLASPTAKVYRNVNEESVEGVRASVRLKPLGPLSVTAGITYQRIQQGGQSLYDSTPGTLAFYQPFDVSEPFSDTFTLYSLTTKYDFGAVLLTLPTGYLSRASSIHQDNSEAVQNGLNLPSYDIAGGGFGAVPVFEFDHTRQFSQEARLSSTSDGPLQWIAGLYYNDYIYTFNSGSAFPYISVVTGGATDILFNAYMPIRIKQEAAFGNASYQVTDHVKLTAGARYFSYQNSISDTQSGVFFTGSAVTVTRSGSASNSGINPMATIAFTPLNDLLLYATAAKGFRDGNGNSPIPTGSTGTGPQCAADLAALGLNEAPAAFDPDTVWNYELGEKISLFERSVTINADVYYLDWSNIQQPVTLQCGLPFTANAGRAAVKGAELEINAALLQYLHFQQSVGYSHAAYTENSLVAGTTTGEKLLNVPDWQIYSSMQFQKSIDAEYEFIVNIANSYVSRSTDLTYGVNRLPSRDLTNLRVGVSRGAVSIAAFIDNALDRQFSISNTGSYTINNPAYNRVATNHPRTIGLDINYRF